MFTPHRLQEINSGIARFATPGKGDFLLGLYYYFIPPIRLHDALCIPPPPDIDCWLLISCQSFIVPPLYFVGDSWFPPPMCPLKVCDPQILPPQGGF